MIDPKQLDFGSLGYGGIMTSLTFAVFSFVGFESAATLARETRNPARNVGLAVTMSALLAGLFFVAITYFMVLGIGDDTRALGDSSAPFIAMTERAGLNAAGTAMYFGALISGLACLLASLNAASRLLFSMARYGYLARRAGDRAPAPPHARHGGAAVGGGRAGWAASSPCRSGPSRRSALPARWRPSASSRSIS